jgi:hypothetical protein
MMQRSAGGRIVVLALAGALTSVPALAQEAGPRTVAPATKAADANVNHLSQDVPNIPLTQADLDRIKKSLANPPILKLDDNRLKFYIQILAKQPQWSEWVKGYDFMNGPTKRGNPMSHQEFVNMVTPKEMYSTAGIRPTELLQFALTNWVGQALIKKALTDVTNARNQHELEAIRDRIDRELAALRGSALSGK